MLQPNTTVQLINVFLQSSFGSISDRLLGLLLSGIKSHIFFSNISSSTRNPPLSNILHVAIKSKKKICLFLDEHICQTQGDLSKCLLPTDMGCFSSAKLISQFLNRLRVNKAMSPAIILHIKPVILHIIFHPIISLKITLVWKWADPRWVQVDTFTWQPSFIFKMLREGA